MRESGVRAGSEGPRLHMRGRGRRGGGSDRSGGRGDGEAGSEGIRTAETARAKERRERGSEPIRQHVRERREMRVLCSEAARETERGGPGGSKGSRW